MRPRTHNSKLTCWRALLLLLPLGLLFFPRRAHGGGPLLVGGPTYGIEGQPIVWNPAAMPVQYRVDGGPLSQKPDGTVVIGNAAGVSRVASMFQVWQAHSLMAT